MHRTLFPVLLSAFFFVSLPAVKISAGEEPQIRIPLPKKSKYTPVQQLNRSGVEALKKHNIDKAKKLFYRAYLIDPGDPFTLNNLGYLSELEGDLDRAQRFYDQAQANTSQAVIDKSTMREVEGKSVAEVAGRTAAGPLQVNALNHEAINLLKKDRAAEADLDLQQSLKLQPRNPFTLNNMGFAKEKEGELEQAIRYYKQAAAIGSQDLVVIAIDKSWQGKTISEIAARNADKATQQLQNSGDIQAQVTRLNLRGVSAMNRNDRKIAREYFRKAYKLDPRNAFALNNMGYLSELDGDRETAQAFYTRARAAERSRTTVAVSTRPELEGRSLEQVARQSNALVETRMEADLTAKRRSTTRPALHTRNNQVIVDKPQTNQQSPENTPPDQNRSPQLQQRPPQ